MSRTCKHLTLSWVLGSARDTMSRRAYRTTECLSIREMSSNRYMLSKAFRKFNGDSLDMIIAYEKMYNLQLTLHGLRSLTCRLQGGYRPLPPSACQRSPTFRPITSTIPSIIRMSVELTELWKIPKHAKMDKTYMYW